MSIYNSLVISAAVGRRFSENGQVKATTITLFSVLRLLCSSTILCCVGDGDAVTVMMAHTQTGVIWRKCMSEVDNIT